MAPSMEPGFGMGVLVGAGVSVFVGEGPIVGVKVGVNATVLVMVLVLVSWARVGEASCSKVGEDNGAGWADCVKTAKVWTTCVATTPESTPAGVVFPGKLQAHRQEVRRAETNSTNGLFIGEHPLDELN